MLFLIVELIADQRSPGGPGGRYIWGRPLHREQPLGGRVDAEGTVLRESRIPSHELGRMGTGAPIPNVQEEARAHRDRIADLGIDIPVRCLAGRGVNSLLGTRSAEGRRYQFGPPVKTAGAVDGLSTALPVDAVVRRVLAIGRNGCPRVVVGGIGEALKLTIRNVRQRIQLEDSQAVWTRIGDHIAAAVRAAVGALGIFRPLIHDWKQSA